jgi:hypothetical protein
MPQADQNTTSGHRSLFIPNIPLFHHSIIPLTLQRNHSHCGSRFFAHIDVEEIFLKNSEVYVISLISDGYGLYFRDKSRVQGFKGSRVQGFKARV